MQTVAMFMYLRRNACKDLGGIDISLAKCLDVKAFEKYPIDEYMVNEDIIINSTGNGTLGRIGMFHDSDRINDLPLFQILISQSFVLANI